MDKHYLNSICCFLKASERHSQTEQMIRGFSGFCHWIF